MLWALALRPLTPIFCLTTEGVFYVGQQLLLRTTWRSSTKVVAAKWTRRKNI